ncbi:hypothetical protein KIF24_06820 [Micromonospora sp. Llam7]|nr:hypothetical protein [Micromonospora tarapacensis]
MQADRRQARLAYQSIEVVRRPVGLDPLRRPQDVTVTAPVVFDSRRVEPGGMFVALPGERVDGHDYATQAADDVRSW